MCEKTTNVPALFGKMVFGEQQMQQRLPAAAYQKWQQCLAQGTPLDRTTAGEIANAMKDWAIEKGATHYTHWFQPMTGVTAEKHDSFITRDGKDSVVMELSAKELSKGEADASSFPSGGLRATFEARGYTAWDPTSYAFVKDETLYIPTIFCSYSGQTLDKKTPLLRSMRVLDRECIRILRLFGNTEAQHVTPQVGPEQEYFLIDEKVYRQREDLKLCGRTLFGARPSKGQELDDHYYGAIKPRVAAFMRELDQELWKLGVLAKTEHNEVAPAQHEIAPIYSDANSACDKNQLTMELLKKVAARHGLVCLLHEKPFAGVNGSGKHDNWSLATDTGENLLKPGSTPSQNAQFLLFLAAFIKGVDEYQEMLRCCVSYPGNDHRLGGNEAPPAIISIFVGEELEAVIDAVCTDSPYAGPVKMKMDLGVDVLPKFSKDTTDRNRTSPFAFTGNKFEFRMPGSAENLSDANTILNTAVAKELKQFVADVEGAADFECAAAAWVKKTLNDHRRVIFNGNGYSEAWEAEAARRGLPNRKCTPDAMVALKEEKNISLMEEFGVLTKTEMLSRYEVEMEHYSKIINIEARTMLKIASKQLIPAATSYMGEVASTAAAKIAAVEGISTKSEAKLLTALSKYTDEMSDATDALKAVTDKVSALDDETAKAHAFHDEVLPAMDTLRAAADAAEELVDEDYWPLPCYSRMLFYTE